ncbi:NAD(P)/FAD-dependent oxidoreductase [Georgenia sp. 10Sc9-8]|uniref:NAD(P)/FAD-dependent oxidoreductase n=1 Tax=Georgenia halotolerans TaxID=3028317 RepID=A0ABT5TWU2_9MICO|nr:NAD(P)/FAD-dependent oxidoreductase [Georgenia halotolerans]
MSIAGAGPVGLATALGLARAGVDVTVLEKDADPADGPRAMAYLYPVLEEFERLGVLDDLDARGVRSESTNIIDHESGEHFPLTFEPLHGVVRHPYTLHLAQNRVSEILLAHLSEFGNVDIRRGTTVVDVVQDDDGVDVQVLGPSGGDRVHSRWLVGADGAGSAVRRAVGLYLHGATWPNRFIAANIRHDFEADGLHAANQCLDWTYGAIITKTDEDGLWRYTYREAGGERAERLPRRIRTHLERALPEVDAHALVQHSSYRMHQRVADTFRAGRVLLAGDAAHITNPVGGLGLNAGFLDASVLAEALAAVVHSTADDAVLDAYAAERRAVFLDVVSPDAVRNKEMVFDPPTGEEKLALLDQLRELARNPDKRRDHLLRAQRMVTPSVVTAAR